ncbi:DNA mismatch repair protein MutL [Aspergillus pseudodeflectus]|uniref:DNA mismatch repair protein MutL n=1 Tax=Aspergillus pseudodeflectus TaxID=176178 RepID=A0ABR4KN37_9EURO
MHVDMMEPRGTKRPIEESEASCKPRKIRALDPDVVNKIAAGEIIVAPMHALKELIENAVDAGSTSLEILVKDGGLKLLQVTDNGHGIEREDLPILCERFTTSKLKEFEDLTSIATYGFRGEALASISHIAHLTVTTKTADSSCAWRAHYSDGKLVPPKPGQSAEPKATAGRGGTQITVEDLFYNVPTRRRAFRSVSEEYAKVLDVVGRYAVHCSGVAFSCRKHGDAGVSISTTAASSRMDRIRQIHGSAVANELVEFSVKDDKLGFSSSGLATNANYHVRRTTILLFINHRSVESTAIKRAVEQTYSTFLPKGGHPFVYLDIEIEPHRLDVNVHPTKREVNFLNEDEIIEIICDEIRSKLALVDSSRTFLTQTLLPSVQTLAPPNRDTEAGPSAPKTPATSKKPYENNLVRTDSRVRKITSMLTPTMHRTSITTTDADGPAQATATQTVLDEGFQYETTDREPLKITLTSVKALRATVRNSMHNTLTETIAGHTYVGLVDEQRRVAAIQSGVKLYLIDYGMFCNEFFYQIGLTDFGNFGTIKLDPAPKLVDIIRIAADAAVENMQPQTINTAAAEEEREVFTKAPETVAQTLIDRREMLSEYFSIEISDDGHLLTIPLLLKGYLPSLGKLPRFLMRLGPYVNWEDEQECFRTFLRELAAFYAPEKLPRQGSSLQNVKSQVQEGEGQGDIQDAEDVEDEYIRTRRAQMVRMLEHVVFPALRARLVATTGLLKGVVEVADLKGLYRVFERC